MPQFAVLRTVNKLMQFLAIVLYQSQAVIEISLRFQRRKVELNLFQLSYHIGHKFNFCSGQHLKSSTIACEGFSGRIFGERYKMVK